MSLTKPDGLKKNKALDLVALAFVAGTLGLTPLLVSLFHDAPLKGPDKNPTILIEFLVFLGVIMAVSVVAVGGMLAGKVKQPNTPDALTPFGLNTLNVLGKVLAGLFLISGFVKLQDPVGFGYKLDDYWTFFHNRVSFFPEAFMTRFSVYIGAFVSVFEVALGFALITGYKMRTTAWLLLLLLLFFTFLTGLAAFTGELQDCGCFGDALKLEPIQTFGKDILLLVPGLVIFLNRRRIHPYYRRPLPGFATVGSFLAGAAISVYCYMHLEMLDFRGAYKVGQDLCYNAVNPDTDGQIIAHDFTYPSGSPAVFCERDFCKGPWLLIVMYDMEGHPKENFEAAAALVNEMKAKASGIQVVGASNTGPSVRKKMGLPFPEDFCWEDMDQKAARTIIRSSPGYVWVQDGIVQRKWHYNDMPTAESLVRLVGPSAETPVVDTFPVPPDSIPQDTMPLDSPPAGE